MEAKPDRAATIVAVGAVLLCLAALALGWPGVAEYDSVEQYRQVLNGVYLDWHPPIMARFWADCSGVEPYLAPMCSTMFSPSGTIWGLSSNGWKAMSAVIPSGLRFSSACSSPPRPTTHQGQTTSETKSIFSGRVAGSVMGSVMGPGS